MRLDLDPHPAAWQAAVALTTAGAWVAVLAQRAVGVNAAIIHEAAAKESSQQGSVNLGYSLG